MILYRGSSSEHFQVKEHIKSRYGFKALFFTDNVDLAQLWAIHRANEMKTKSGGFVYEFEVPEPRKTVDLKFTVTHTRQFRRLIHKLFEAGHRSAMITNCYDYPSDEMKRFIPSSVVVVFDLSIIKDYKLIEP